jgi:hypothetical protein
VAGVTPQSPSLRNARHEATCWRISLMIGLGCIPDRRRTVPGIVE